MDTILVTGGAGFIGSNFIHYLLEEDPSIRIFNLDALTYAGSKENLNNLPDPTRHRFIRGDICDRGLVDQIFSEHNIDVVVHFAAESHVDRSILGPEQFIKTNIDGTFTLLEVAREHWRSPDGGNPREKRFHHISTDEVYGSLQPGDPAFTEETPYAPRSPYAASKAASDHLVRAYHHTYNLPITITNCSNNYGPYQFPEKLIPVIILNAVRGKSLPIYGDGQQIRDWLFVRDHCRAIWDVLRDGAIGETYNIGGENQPTNLQIVHKVCNILDEKHPDSRYIPHKQLIEHVQDRPGHDRRYAMDTSKISRELGWCPAVSLDQGLERTVDWYLNNSDWVKTIEEKGGYQAWMEENYQGRESL